jgi:chemotaxis protein methyltransferase CheR
VPEQTAAVGSDAGRAELVRVAAELLGAEIGTARRADLDRAARATVNAAGEPLDDAALARRLRAAPPGDELRRAFVGALTISETHFFRVRSQFDALAERVIPALIEARRTTQRLRLWSAGCSTGEEAWSLAILLERLAPPGWDATVLGTDVDEGALDHARRGVYGPRAFRDAPEWMRARWFTRILTESDVAWEVDPRLRRRVRFAALNLVDGGYPSDDSGTSGIDLLLCRNVLIYFTAEARARTAARLAACLTPGGWLAVAPAEMSAALFPGFDVHRFPAAIFHQRPDKAGPAAAPPPSAPFPPRPVTSPAPAPPPARPSGAERLEEARAYADRGEPDEAERLLSAALAADPLLAPARELRAHLLLDRGDADGAEAELRAALFLDPCLVVAHATLAALLARRGERSRAAAAAAEVRRLLAGRASDDPVPGAGDLTVGRLLADLAPAPPVDSPELRERGRP